MQLLDEFLVRVFAIYHPTHGQIRYTYLALPIMAGAQGLPDSGRGRLRQAELPSNPDPDPNPNPNLNPSLDPDPDPDPDPAPDPDPDFYPYYSPLLSSPHPHPYYIGAKVGLLWLV